MASEFALWPVCAHCSEKEYRERTDEGYKLERWPRIVVEAYDMLESKPRGPRFKKTVIINAQCHGQGQAAVIDVPWWWGDAHVSDAIKGLVFFQSGRGAPEHNLVDSIG